jgi:hypothetical protein
MLSLVKFELIRVQWNASKKEPVDASIEAGLAAVEHSIQIKGDAAKAYSIKAQLLLFRGSAGEAIDNFDRASRLNPLLQPGNRELYTRAKSLL